MKSRLIAILLLLMIALAACTPNMTPPPTEATARPKPTEATKLTEATETTEEATEAPTEATEAPTEPPTEVDLGTVDGTAYKNETLGIVCDFPEGWYIYNETDLAALNNFMASAYDSKAITAALENSQAFIIFCASYPATISSVNITVSKNLMSGMSEEDFIDLSLPLMKAQIEQTGVMQNVACEAAEAEFCGQKHTVLKVSGEAAGMHLYETIVYLIFDSFVYNVTVSTTQETDVTEILGLFEVIG